MIIIVTPGMMGLILHSGLVRLIRTMWLPSWWLLWWPKNKFFHYIVLYQGSMDDYWMFRYLWDYSGDLFSNFPYSTLWKIFINTRNSKPSSFLPLEPCLIYDTLFRQTKEWRQAAEPAYRRSRLCRGAFGTRSLGSELVLLPNSTRN